MQNQGTRKPSPELLKSLATNIINFRKAMGYSQEELADLCGMHRTYVGSVERCERNVTLSTLETIADALNVSVPKLLTEDVVK